MELFLETLLLVAALSVDALTAAFAYGSDRIRVPIPSALVISGICSLTLSLSLLAGNLARPLLPSAFAQGASFWLLAAIGCAKLFDSSIKAAIRRHGAFKKRLSLTAFRLRFILTVYADPAEADRDASRRLSLSEAAALALALSLDGLAVGFGAALSQTSWITAGLLALPVSLGAVCVGCALGRVLARRLQRDYSWIGGALLLLLALLKTQ